MYKFLTIIIFIVIILLICSCTTNNGNYCGGFPSRPKLRQMQNDSDINTIMQNTIQSQKYIELNEKAKEECPYVISY